MPTYRTYLELDVDPGGAIPGLGHPPHIRFRIEKGGPVIPTPETWGMNIFNDHQGAAVRTQSYPDDTWIRSGALEEARNYGADDEIVSTVGSFESSPLILYNLERRLQGDQPLYQGAIIYSAKLWFRLKSTASLVGNHAIYVFRLLKPWVEGVENNSFPSEFGATWLDAITDPFFFGLPWDTPGAKAIGSDRVAVSTGEIVVNAADPVGTWFSVDVTLDLQNMVDVPGNNFGWILVTADTSQVVFHSKEGGQGDRPYLEVSYDQGPVPPAEYQTYVDIETLFVSDLDAVPPPVSDYYYADAYTSFDWWPENPANSIDGNIATFGGDQELSGSPFQAGNMFGLSYGGIPGSGDPIKRIEWRAYGWALTGNHPIIEVTHTSPFGGLGNHQYRAGYPTDQGVAGWGRYMNLMTLKPHLAHPTDWTWPDIQAIQTSFYNYIQGFFGPGYEVARYELVINRALNGTLALRDSDDQGTNYEGVWAGGSANWPIVLVARDTGGLSSYRDDGLGNLTLLDTDFIGPSGYSKVWGEFQNAFVACLDSGIRTYSFNSSGNLTPVDNDIQGFNFYFDVWGDHGGRIFVANSGDGVRSYTHVSGNLTYRDVDDQGGAYYGVWGDGNFLYCATSWGLLSYSYDAVGTLTFIDSHLHFGNNRNVWGDGQFVYTAAYDGLRSYSVDGGGNLTFIDLDKQGSANYVDVWGDGQYIYVAGSGQGIRVYSVDPFGNLNYVGVKNNGDSYQNIFGIDNTIYAACFTGGLRTYQLENS